MINPSPESSYPPGTLRPPVESAGSATPTHSLSRSRRNVGEPGKYWPQNTTLTIAMYEYEMHDEYVLAVKKAAGHWLPHINLKFDFVSGERGDIRIAQNPPGNSGGASSIGTDARNIAFWMPTMSLPMNHNDPCFEYTVMHEFGHMLGAHHAHQHPDANIPWNRENIHKTYRGTTNPHAVQDNILPLTRSNAYDLLPYDPESVMHYAVSPDLTDGKREHIENRSLSDGDIAWAKKAYPAPQAAPIPPVIRHPRFRDADFDCTV